MPVYELEKSVKAHADVVWAVISEVEALAEVAHNIKKADIVSGENEPIVRRCYDYRDRTWDEHFVDWQEGQGYAYEVDINQNYPFPFRRLRGSFRMEEHDDHIVVRMRYDYNVKWGLIGRLYDRFYLKKRFRQFCNALMENWVFRIRDREWIYQVNAETILRRKGYDVLTLSQDVDILDVARTLREKRVGAILLVDANNKVVGLVSERDIVNALGKHGADVLGKPVSGIMTRKLVVCSPEDDMVHVMACMTDRRVRHLPVMKGDELVGIISIGDVVKERMANLEAESETMRAYIEAREWRYLHQLHANTGVHDVAELRREMSGQ